MRGDGNDSTLALPSVKFRKTTSATTLDTSEGFCDPLTIRGDGCAVVWLGERPAYDSAGWRWVGDKTNGRFVPIATGLVPTRILL